VADWDAVLRKQVHPPFYPSKSFVHEVEDPYTALLNYSANGSGRYEDDKRDEYIINADQEEEFQDFNFICNSHVPYFKKKPLCDPLVRNKQVAFSAHAHAHAHAHAQKAKMYSQGVVDKSTLNPRRASVSTIPSSGGTPSNIPRAAAAGGKPTRNLPKIF